MSQESPSGQAKAENTNLLVGIEYKTLRDEVLKRIEFRYQTINLILIVAGTFLTVGLQTNTASVLLVYPVLAMFLAVSWAHNGLAMLYIDRYVRDHLETKALGLHWETYVKEHSPRSTQPFSSFGAISTAGLVLSTQLLSVGLALLRPPFTAIETTLLICSVASILLTLALLSYTTRIQR